MHISGARNVPHPVRNLLRDDVILLMFVPTTCTSIGAGNPKFKIWVTMSAGWKKNSLPGNF